MSQSAYLSNHEPTRSYASLSYFDFEQHAKEWQDVILTHPFNHKLSVFLPFCDTDTARAHLNEAVGNYDLVDLPLSSILDPDFLSSVVRSDTHQFLLHSIDTHLDTDDVVTIDHNGKLVFSLLKSTYESFGIVAEHGQNKQDRLRQKYVVSIDLRDRKLIPGSKKYDRLKSCMENTFAKNFRAVAVCFDKESGETKEINWPSNVSKQTTSMDIKNDSLTYISIPSFDHLRCSFSTKPDAVWQHNTLKALEWIGLANIKANRIDANDKPDSFVSVYYPPSAVSTGSGVLLQWSGLIPTLFIRHVLIAIKKLLLSKEQMRWASLSVWGYRDSPFTWESQQHYSFTNGENDYSFVLLAPESNDTVVATIGCQMYGGDHIQK
ncbi:ribonuclease P 40kDa subunit-domain-containing protein [Fennellomyces sp. T-0311]|nr:ribonuclease P 40kDa subunit-domain-containing protein [Fennellomyces sp. T-0311]